MKKIKITFVEENSGDPTLIVLKDTFLRITILAWIGAFIWIIYL